MRHQRLRVELRLDGELKARYQGDYLTIAECGAPVLATQPPARKPVRKDHNAGGKSAWMQGFFDRPSPPLWKADRRLRCKPIGAPGNARRSSRWMPKASAREFHQKHTSSPTGKPSARNGPVSPGVI